jgi:bifunctional ADP-heptose synthase (sugar kinase/adenylyltransferase)
VLLVRLAAAAACRAAGRSIGSERRRAETLLALRMVDYVHILDASGLDAFLDALNPDVHVDGCPRETAVERVQSGDAADAIEASSAIN